MRLAEFIESNRERLVQRWERNVTERLSLDLEKSQLRNDLPHFVDDVIEALRGPTGKWPHVEGARKHGRQRMRLGANIGTLTEEMTLVGVAIAELAEERGAGIAVHDLIRMMGIVGRGAAASVEAYAVLRDKELADQAAQHFSFIAHEIRNPLQNASLAAQTLALVPHEQRAKHLDRLERALSQLTELVNDSLIESRLYSEPKLNVQKLESTDVVESVCNDLAAQMSDRGQTLTTGVDEFVLEADRTILVSALTNLLRNASKFSPDGGRLSIAARLEADQAVFEIGDQCGGIPEEFLPRLFRPFEQARADRGGSGLGLVIVRQAAEAHGGSVSAENRPGHGCTFVLDLPLRRPQG